MSIEADRTFTVDVPGGSLYVGVWGDGPPVLAAHGITASHMSWSLVAQRVTAAGRSLVAPDLRGRGNSNAISGPWGLSAHADDLVAVLDALDVERVVLAGHSMGAFVATVAGVRHAERWERIVLVDGGLPLPEPPGDTVEEKIQAVIGPAMARLAMTFESRSAYHDFWRQHPAFAGGWNQAVEAYVDYDLTGTEPELRSKVSRDAIVGDGGDTLVDTTVATALERLPCPATLLYAPQGLLGAATPGLYADDVVAETCARIDNLDAELVPDVNHYTITMSDHGADTVAAHLLR